MNDYQESIVQAIETIVQQMIDDTSYTSSSVGVVTDIQGLDCKVKIFEKDVSCTLLEHMVGKVYVGDVVVVQDLYNDGQSKYVQSKLAGIS